MLDLPASPAFGPQMEIGNDLFQLVD